MASQIITLQDFTSVQKAQAGISRLFKTAASKKRFYSVMRNQEHLGVLIPKNLWESLIEDLEALSSSSYIKRIAQSRADKKTYSSAEIKKKLGLK
jgi:PHD/YefM family antitoxin component YafN of YafNO toxin-antitoxin module